MAYKLGTNEYRRQFNANRRKQGLCLECNHKVIAPHTRCHNCLARRRNKKREYQQQAAIENKCDKCFKADRLPHSINCEKCFLKNTSFHHFGTYKMWVQLQAMFNDQERKCALSGVRVALGTNAELDHIIPLARGGSKDVSNTQWVHVAVNRMKEHLIESEFFIMIEALYHQMRTSCGG